MKMIEPSDILELNKVSRERFISALLKNGCSAEKAEAMTKLLEAAYNIGFENGVDAVRNIFESKLAEVKEKVAQ